MKILTFLFFLNFYIVFESGAIQASEETVFLIELETPMVMSTQPVT